MKNPKKIDRTKSMDSYILKVGEQATERLDLLDRVYGHYSRNLLLQLIKKDMKILTFGCGTGNLEIWISQHIGNKGSILATDISMEQIKIAQKKASALGVNNIHFTTADVCEVEFNDKFDLVHCRYVLMHLRHPQKAIKKMVHFLTEKGTIFLEEVANNTGFSSPYNASVRQALNLMSRISRIRKLDYEIGHKLFSLLQENKVIHIEMKANQPLFSSGEEKTYLVQSIKEAAPILVRNKTISKEALSLLVGELEDFTNQPHTLIGLPTSYQALGIRE